MDYAWELFIDSLGTFLFYIFVNGKLERKEIYHTHIKQLIICTIISVILWIMNICNLPSIVTILVVLVLFHYIYTEIFFASSHIAKFFWVIVFGMTTIFAEALATIIPTQIFHIELSQELMGGNLRIPFTLLYMLLITVFILILLCFSSKTFKLNFSEKICFISMSLFCIVIENIIVVTQTIKFKNNISLLANTLYILFFLVLALFVSFTIYVYQLGIQREKNVQLSEDQIMTNMENKQYEQVISSITELRYIKHDINNHLNAINMLLHNKNYNEAHQYIQNLSNSMESDHYVLTSGNSTMDSILTNKLIQCKSSGIKVSYSVFLPEHIPLSDIEICSVIGNLFDNAIEACSRLSAKKEKCIDISIKPFQDMLSLMIVNTTDGIYITQKANTFASRKKNLYDANHGLGLSRVQTVVEKHNGMMEITPSKENFTVTILLPLSENEEIS
ncbi:MAG: GHKL domain-containing protein [Coprococcus sp.]|nr:GHKL domain-containing protein [Coprococcus sp.]